MKITIQNAQLAQNNSNHLNFKIMMAPDPRWVGGQERSMRNLSKDFKYLEKIGKKFRNLQEQDLVHK